MATVARTPDAELLLRLRRRDREAWEELYAEYQPRLRGFAYRLAGNVHDADDLVQETFVRAVPRLDRLDPQTTDIGAYLFTTLRNLFLKQVERTKRQQPVAEVPEPVLPTPIDDDPERGTLLHSQQDEVRLANSKLQPRQRLVLALRELEDRSYAEIGELVDMKENAVAQLIFRARESLRLELRLAQVDPERLPEECRRYLPLLAAHLDGQLKGARQEETLAHLEGCERCQDALASMREASKRYRTLILPGFLETDEARAAVERRLDAVHYWDRRGGRLLAGRTKRSIAVVAAIVALSGGGTALGVALSRDGAAAETHAQATTEAEGEEQIVDQTVPTTTAPAPPTTRKQSPAPKPVAPAVTSKATTAPTTEPVTTAEETVETAPVTQVTEPEPKPAPKPKPNPKPKPKVIVPQPDTTAPTVKITQAPRASVSSSGAQIRFTANEPGATFACKLDAASYSACTSPRLLAGLAPGNHAFAVRATDRSGNVGKPASASWRYVPPDTTAPTVTLATTPPASTTETSASFAFTASEPGVAFECLLDGGAYTGCVSPASYQSLGVGTHSFAVRGRDEAGNVGQPATFGWSIIAPPPPPLPPLPDLYVASFTKNTIIVRNGGNAAAGSTSVLTISVVNLQFTVPNLAAGASVTFNWGACAIGTYVAIVDRTNVVAESNETNNTASRPNSSCP
jgi:RNA polymerase sigma factor (sigma-70 family)